MDDDSFVIGLIVLVIGIALLIGFVMWSDSKSCYSGYENYQPKWGVFSGCRVMWDGKLTPVDIVREIH